MVALLQRLHAGRVVSVLMTVLVSVAVAGGIGWIIAKQLVDVANQIPLYRQNIHAKIEAFHLPATGQFGQAAKSVQEIVEVLHQSERAVPGPGSAGPQRTSRTYRPRPCLLPPFESFNPQPADGRNFAIWAGPFWRLWGGREWSSSLRSSCC